MIRARVRMTALAVAVAVGSSGTASAAPGKGSLNAFRDTNPLPAESTQQAGLAASQLRCQGLSIPAGRAAQLPPGFPVPTPPRKKRKKVRIPSFRTALAHAQRAAEGRGAKKVLTRLRRGPALRTEPAARGFAVAAELAGSPRLALAGLLAAHRLDPGDRMNLINAAAPLAMVGKPADAISLIDHAAKMPGALPTVMGVAGKAVLENNRGYAYAKLRSHGASIAALKKAVAAAPAMAEANTNLGSELLCAGRGAEALKYLRAGLARNTFDRVSPAPSGVGAFGDQVPTVPIASQVADLSAGQDGTLPSFVTPSGPAQWVAFQPRVVAMNDAANAESQKATTDRTAALEQAKALPASIATTMRSNSLADLVNTSLAEPEIKALEDKALKALEAATAVTDRHWAVAVPAKSDECRQSGTSYEECFEPWCKSATATASGGFNSAFSAAESAVREYWRVAGRRETGLAANLSDQAWHDVAMADVRVHATIQFGRLISAMQGWVGPLKFFETSCVTGSEPPPAGAEGAPTVASPGACPPALAGLTGTFKHGVDIPPAAGKEKGSKVDVSVKVSCSKAEIELSHKVAGTGDLISVFGKGEQDFKSDTTTVVVGTKGSVLGLATGQSGFYVTAGKQGIEDFGWRVGAGGAADPFGGLSNATVGVKTWGGSENISFVGAVDYIPTAFGVGGG